MRPPALPPWVPVAGLGRHDNFDLEGNVFSPSPAPESSRPIAHLPLDGPGVHPVPAAPYVFIQ